MHRVVRERELKHFSGASGEIIYSKALRPMKNHPHHSAHRHVMKNIQTVVSTIGPRLSSVQSLGNPPLLRRRKRNAQHVLVLFVPHKSPQVLVGVTEDTNMRDVNDET